MTTVNTPETNRQVQLASRPEGIPQAEHFEIVETPIAAASAGQVQLRNLFLSVEPAMRGWVNAVGNYSEPVGIGEVMRSFALAVVEDSRDPRYRAGDIVTGLFGWQSHPTVAADLVDRLVKAEESIPVSTALGVLGLNGITAYFGLLDCGLPKAGETVVVSTAAGAVGSAVGQIAKIHGCHVVGITGGEKKVELCLDTFGFDACIDYKSADDLQQQLASVCPSGVDVYFDNTAGPISDAVMPLLNLHARVVICGTASIASWDPVPQGPRVERHLLVKRATMRGILIFDYVERYGEAREKLAEWIRNGQLRYVEDILEGIEAAPDAIAGLYRGDNFGKRLIRLADSEHSG